MSDSNHSYPGRDSDVFRPLTIAIFLTGCLLLTQLQPAEAMRFYRYTNEQGETVISNVPPNCVNNARLTCMDRHPVSVGPPAAPTKTPEKTTRSTTSAQSPSVSSRQAAQPGTRSKPTENNAYQPLFDMLDQVVERKQLLDEYYTATPDPDTAAQVRAQQQDIMDILQTIRGSADSEDQSTIDRAIDIFRSNLYD